MSKNIKPKKPKQKPVITTDVQPELPRYISFSFRYLSKNKQRNFDFFSYKEWKQKGEALYQLFCFLQRLSDKTEKDIVSLSKHQDSGFEMLKFKDVNCLPNGRTLSKEDNIFVFRFGNNGNGGDYRLLGFFEDKSSVLYVIGFDFDYSAYRHD